MASALAKSGVWSQTSARKASTRTPGGEFGPAFAFSAATNDASEPSCPARSPPETALAAARASPRAATALHAALRATGPALGSRRTPLILVAEFASSLGSPPSPPPLTIACHAAARAFAPSAPDGASDAKRPAHAAMATRGDDSDPAAAPPYVFNSAANTFSHAHAQSCGAPPLSAAPRSLALRVPHRRRSSGSAPGSSRLGSPFCFPSLLRAIALASLESPAAAAASRFAALASMRLATAPMTGSSAIASSLYLGPFAAASARESACLAATWSGDLTAVASALGLGTAESAFLSPSSDPAMNRRRAPSAALAAASVCAASPPSVFPVLESNMLDLPLGCSPALSDSIAPTVPWCSAPAASGTPALAAATSALVASIRLTPARIFASSPRVLMHWLVAALTVSFVPNPARP